MSETYQGNPSNVEILSASVTGVTAGPNSAITTGTAHGFSSGDSLIIYGVTGIAGVNTGKSSNDPGTPWSITVTGPDSFTINNGSTTGAYSSGGTAVDLSLNPPIELPADGDSMNAASVNNAFQQLADQLQYVNQNLASLSSFSSVGVGSTTWTAPKGVNWVIVAGCGGGGGGEGSQPGQAAVSGAAEVICTGGGGAGAPYHFEVVDVTPGFTYNVGVGAGGAGGVAGHPGQDGNESYFRLNTGRPTYSPDVQMPGGAGAGADPSVVASGEIYALQGSNGCMIAPGGDSIDIDVRPWPFTPVRADGVSLFAGLKLVSATNLTNILNYISRRPGAGGAAVAAPDTDYAAYGSQSTAGVSSEQEYAGGAPGTIGATGTGGGMVAPGGAAGGGGGGGPFGPGGNGGNGGAGSHTAAGSQGTNGTAAAANTGAGGGGGGGGGWAVSSGVVGAGSAGGAGGNGVVLLFWVQTVVV